VDEFVQSLITTSPSVIALVFIIIRQERRLDALQALIERILLKELSAPDESEKDGNAL